MSKKPTYNSFEDLIKDNLDKFESNHGKDWSAISNKLDKIDAVNKNKKSRSNLFLALSLICAISLVTVWYYNENKPLNTVVKNEALTTKINLEFIDEMYRKKFLVGKKGEKLIIIK